VADCAEELLAVSSSMQEDIHSMNEQQISALLSPAIVVNILDISTDLKIKINLSVSNPKLLKSALLSRKMDEYLRKTLIMESMGAMTRLFHVSHVYSA
jgi:hypothetical protein